MTRVLPHSTTDAEAWDRIWGQRLTSLQPGDPSLSLVEAWWLRELRQLGRLERVLEIGAGAAALVARLVVQHFPGTPVIASDYRALPGTLDQRIVAISNAPIEVLPFPDACIDMLASQFAFEYADRARAVGEVARVLRPGGVARMLLHHPGSFFSRKLVHRLRTLQATVTLERVVADATLASAARQVRLRQAQAKLHELQRAQAAGPAIPEVLADLADFNALAQRLLDSPLMPPATEDLQLLAQCAPALQLTRLQMRAAITADALRTLEQRFGASGCVAAHDILTDAQQQPLAWILRLRRVR